MNKEKQILHHIKINPFISQQELSTKVGLSRSAVANYIANLTKRGEIKGRAYILQEESSIVCIGGANTDRKARSNQKVRLYSSNPVKTTEVCGGVARNFAENLSRLGYNTSLMTSIGDDKEGNWMLRKRKVKELMLVKYGFCRRNGRGLIPLYWMLMVKRLSPWLI